MKKKPSTEIEYKFVVSNKARIISLMNKKGKKIINKEYQISTMFDNSERLMQTTNGRIRARTLGNTKKKELTYKRPLKPKARAKREIEYEIEFMDTDNNVEKILNALGFFPTTSYECYRTSWMVKNILVTLDEYPHAVYLEIEGKQKAIQQLSRYLGFNLKDALTKPVDTLFQEWREERSMSYKPHIRFNDYNK